MLWYLSFLIAYKRATSIPPVVGAISYLGWAFFLFCSELGQFDIKYHYQGKEGNARWTLVLPCRHSKKYTAIEFCLVPDMVCNISSSLPILYCFITCFNRFLLSGCIEHANLQLRRAQFLDPWPLYICTFINWTLQCNVCSLMYWDQETPTHNLS